MKKIILILLLLMMTVSCTACDNDEESNDYGVLVEINYNTSSKV